MSTQIPRNLRSDGGREASTLIIKIILIITFLFTSYCIISIPRNVTQYEFSIYSMPPIFWRLSLLSLFVASIVYMYVSIKDICRSCSLIRLSLIFQIVLLTQVVLLLPLIKNYYFYGRGDPLTTFGELQDIIIYGHIIFERSAANIIYPAIHILMVGISFASGIVIEKILLFFPAYFTLLFIIFNYLLSRLVLKNKKTVAFSLIVSTFFILNSFSTAVPHVTIMIQGISCMVSILLYFSIFRCMKSSTVSFSTIVVIFLLLYPFLHPVTSVVLIINLITIIIMTVILTKTKYKTCTRMLIFKMNHLRNYVLVFLITLFTWTSINSSFWSFSVKRIFVWYLGEFVGRDYVNENYKLVSRAGALGYDVGEIFFKIYGLDLVLLCISSLSILYLIYKIFKENEDYMRSHYWLYILAGVFVIDIMIQLAHMLSGFLPLYADRFIMFPLIITPIFVAFFISASLNKRCILLITIIILLIMSSVNIFSIHKSPDLFRKNEHVTCAEIGGFSWLLEFKNPTFKMIDTGGFQVPFVRAIMGKKNSLSRNDISYGDEGVIPPNFGYPEFSSLGQQFENYEYLLLSISDVKVYSQVIPLGGLINCSDFLILDVDNSVNNIFDNNALEISYVVPRS